jgi:hypothetical protein
MRDPGMGHPSGADGERRANTRCWPHHADGSRAERCLAAPAAATRFSTGSHATSLTAPFTAPHRADAGKPMQVSRCR